MPAALRSDWSLADWLAWQETLHPKGIDLGLERVRAVAARLDLLQPSARTIVVGGTNGKGSTLAFLEAMLLAAGRRVAAYTSPHLLRYEERLRLDGRECPAGDWCRAFAAVDAARGDQSLTYFEFGTLAALWLARAFDPEVLVLEVGLGGRLDAVNIIDADVAIVTTIGIDHTEFLGPDRESIGCEKAGIYRPGRPAICVDPSPPASLLAHQQAIGARPYRFGHEFGVREARDGWGWWGPGGGLDLPWPSLAGPHQLANAAGAVAALRLLPSIEVSGAAIASGIAAARLAGRFQIESGAVEWVFDVTHNPHGAAVLAETLQRRPVTGQTWLLLAMLADKDAAGVIAALTPVVDRWCAAGLDGARGRPVESMLALLPAGTMACKDVTAACRQLESAAQPGDRVIVCGSFLTVAEAMRARHITC
ncbi:MAG TPA: bifunctional tetrahydrofolate synthase/dihydrofolate synthase [Plasticicumulans sp.]|nr:bifunctional tetrahydrofolate synthase/dihydrofolate synthase [Plasticicumulans sp.]